MNIRKGQLADLEALIRLESSSFEPERRDGRDPIRRSLQSGHQEVWVAEEEAELCASMTLRFHPRTCRIYSIAVHPSQQGKGLGSTLLKLAEARGREKGCRRLNLEVDARNKTLIEWYRRHGYQPLKELPDYYATNWHGLRLTRPLPRP